MPEAEMKEQERAKKAMDTLREVSDGIHKYCRACSPVHFGFDRESVRLFVGDDVFHDFNVIKTYRIGRLGKTSEMLWDDVAHGVKFERMYDDGWRLESVFGKMLRGGDVEVYGRREKSIRDRLDRATCVDLFKSFESGVLRQFGVFRFFIMPDLLAVEAEATLTTDSCDLDIVTLSYDRKKKRLMSDDDMAQKVIDEALGYREA